jgi:predicted O-methyltransferase YrrM
LYYLLAKLSGARRIFEMGSAIGYSTIWWARGAGEDARVIYTDGDSNNAMEAYKNFERAGVEKRIEIKVGDALELLSEQNLEPFDIIFNDVDKEDYPKVFRLAVPRLRRGGLFVTDNVLWSGRVAHPAEKNERSASTRAIQEFNRLLYSSKELFPTILPLRDGVAVALKQ